MTGMTVQHPRNHRSRCRNPCSTSRNRCSTSAEIRVHLPPESVFKISRNTHRQPRAAGAARSERALTPASTPPAVACLDGGGLSAVGFRQMESSDPDYPAFLSRLPRLRRSYDRRLHQWVLLSTGRGDSLRSVVDYFRDTPSVSKINRQTLRRLVAYADYLTMSESTWRRRCAEPGGTTRTRGTASRTSATDAPQHMGWSAARTWALSLALRTSRSRQKGPILSSCSAFLWAIFSLTVRGRSTARNQSAPTWLLTNG